MRALRAFCAAAERLSFRHAADDLFLTASAISHQVKQLEAEVGEPLFLRLSRGLELTAKGEQFANELAPVLRQLDAVVDAHCGESLQQEVRLSVRPLFANELLMPRLGEFLKSHPGFRIRVETGEDIESRDHGADASIRLFTDTPQGGNWDRLFAVSLIPVGSMELYRMIDVVAGRIRSPFPLIVHDRRPNAWRDWQKASGLKLPKDCPVISVNSTLSVARAAENGLGAALLPDVLCESSIRDGAIVPLFDPVLESGEAYYFGNDKTADDQPKLAEFRDWVLQEFATGT